MLSQIEKNLYLVNKKIDEACKIYQKDRQKINLVAVSKKFPAENIIEAINANCKIFGENYVKEAEEKWIELKKEFPDVKLHFIGGLQSNKVKKALDLFDVIESLDSEKLALEFKKEIAKRDGKQPEFFIQVNIGEEEQKSGVLPKNLNEFIDFAKNECKLNVSGLMCIPPSNELAAPYFALLCKMAKENNLPNLSMGMSADFDQAIAMDANFIRVGTAIFGKRL